jgi:hypothetical protein
MLACGGPGRTYNWNNLNKSIYVKDSQLSHVPEVMKTVSISQGMLGSASEGHVEQAPQVENFLHILDNPGGVRAQVLADYAGGKFDPESSFAAMTNFLNDSYYRSYYPAVTVNGISWPTYLSALVTFGCAASPAIQTVVDPNGIATRAAFNGALRNLVDKLWNTHSANVAIGSDELCNPAGKAAGSGYCINMFDTLTFINNNAPNPYTCMQNTIADLVYGTPPNYWGCFA